MIQPSEAETMVFAFFARTRRPQSTHALAQELNRLGYDRFEIRTLIDELVARRALIYTDELLLTPAV